jgi:hypothetical protein
MKIGLYFERSTTHAMHLIINHMAEHSDLDQMNGCHAT